MRLLTTSVFSILLLIDTVVAAPTNRIFVTNERDDTMSVINGKTLEVEKTIAVGDRPRGIGLSPDGSELYVAVNNEIKVKVFDPVTLEMLREFEAGSDPEVFAVHPNGNIYISSEYESKALVFNPRTGEKLAEIRVGLEPEGVAVSPDGKRVIVTSESTNMLHVILAENNIIENEILVGSRPRAATFNNSGDIAFATASVSGEVVKVDLNSGKILKIGSTGDGNSKPRDVLLNKDESKLYVAGGRANVILVMDANTLKIQKKIPVGERVWGLAMTKDKKRLFTTDGISGTVSVIDTDNDEVIKTIDVGKFPWGVVVHD